MARPDGRIGANVAQAFLSLRSSHMRPSANTSEMTVRSVETAAITGETSQRSALYILTGSVIVSGPVMK